MTNPSFGIEYAKYSGSKQHVEYVSFKSIEDLKRGLLKLPHGMQIAFYVVNKHDHSKSIGNFKVITLLNTLKKLPTA